MLTNVGTFRSFPKLARSKLPELVAEQRTLEAQIAPHLAALNKSDKPDELPLVEREKAVRAQIDALLQRAGLKNCEGVTCNGYEVNHYERAGQSRLNTEKLVEHLVAKGVDREFLEQAIAEATETGDPVKFATVKPEKGAKVRKPAAA